MKVIIDKEKNIISLTRESIPVEEAVRLMRLVANTLEEDYNKLRHIHKK